MMSSIHHFKSILLFWLSSPSTGKFCHQFFPSPLEVTEDSLLSYKQLYLESGKVKHQSPNMHIRGISLHKSNVFLSICHWHETAHQGSWKLMMKVLTFPHLYWKRKHRLVLVSWQASFQPLHSLTIKWERTLNHFESISNQPNSTLEQTEGFLGFFISSRKTMLFQDS